MIDFIFRAVGDRFDVRGFFNISGWKFICYRVKDEEISFRSNSGKIVKTGKISDKSGFNLEIYSSKQYSSKVFNNGMGKAVKFIKENKKYLKILKNSHVKMCIDVGIVPGKSFFVGTYFRGDILRLAYEYKIDLATTVYPSANSKGK